MYLKRIVSLSVISLIINCPNPYNREMEIQKCKEQRKFRDNLSIIILLNLPAKRNTEYDTELLFILFGTAQNFETNCKRTAREGRE